MITIKAKAHGIYILSRCRVLFESLVRKVIKFAFSLLYLFAFFDSYHCLAITQMVVL